MLRAFPAASPPLGPAEPGRESTMSGKMLVCSEHTGTQYCRLFHPSGSHGPLHSLSYSTIPRLPVS